MGCGSSSSSGAAAAGVPTAHSRHNELAEPNKRDTKESKKGHGSSKEHDYKPDESPNKEAGGGGSGGSESKASRALAQAVVSLAASAASNVVASGVTHPSLSGMAGTLLTRSSSTGPYLLRSNLPPHLTKEQVSFLRTIVRQMKFLPDQGLKSLSRSGKILFTSLETCYHAYDMNLSKFQWLSEFLLELKLLELEIQNGDARTRLKSSTFLLLLSDQVDTFRTKLLRLNKRDTMTSFWESGEDLVQFETWSLELERLKDQTTAGVFDDMYEDVVMMEENMKGYVTRLKKDRMVRWGSRPYGPSVQTRLDMLTNSKLLTTLLTPLRFDEEIEILSKQFCQGTRIKICESFKSWSRLRSEWVTTNNNNNNNNDGGDVDNRNVYNAARERMFLLHGGPGMGTTVLSGHLMSYYGTLIGGVHFCEDSSRTRSNPMSILKSILYQLLQQLPTMKIWFMTKMMSTNSNMEIKLRTNGFISPIQFFEEFILNGLQIVDEEARRAIRQAETTSTGLDPILAASGILPACVIGESRVVVQVRHTSEVDHVLPPSKLLIFIDSIDQSTPSSNGAREGGDDLLSILSNHNMLSKLPPWIGFVVTSHSEDRILDRIVRPHMIVHQLSMHDPENRMDLERYIRIHLPTCFTPEEDLELGIHEILEKSEGSFLYAAMILERHIHHHHHTRHHHTHPRMTLDDIRMCPNGMKEWFAHTMKRIKRAPEFHATSPTTTTADSTNRTMEEATPSLAQLSSTQPSWEHAMWILRLLVAACEPLRISALSELLHCSTDLVESILIPMRSILPIQPSTRSNASSSESTVHIFHRSLREWLIDTERKESEDEEEHQVWIDTTLGEEILFEQCIKRIFVQTKEIYVETSSTTNDVTPMVPFPLIRVDELLESIRSSQNTSSQNGLDSYAIHWTARHLLTAEPVKAIPCMRALHCSLQFLALRIELNETHDFLHDFYDALSTLELFLGVTPASDTDVGVGGVEQLLSPSWSRVRRLNLQNVPRFKFDLRTFQEFKRFLQSELRHLTHGFEFETQSDLTFQYAASYPTNHIVCQQALQTNLLQRWYSGTHSVDHVRFVNKPNRLSALVESWTDITNRVLCIAYHPSHRVRLMLTGYDNGRVTLWNSRTGEVVRQWQNSSAGRCTGVAFMYDGDVVASIGEDGRIRAWDIHQSDDEPLAILPPIQEGDASTLLLQGEAPAVLPGPLTCLAFTSDATNKFILVGSSDGHIYIYERKTLRLKSTLSGSKAGITALAYSAPVPDAPLAPAFIVATSTDGSIRRWPFNIKTGQATLPPHEMARHTSEVLSIAIAPTNAIIAVGTIDGAILLFDGITSHRLTSSLPTLHRSGVTSLDFNPINGNELVSASNDETVRTWSIVDHSCTSLYTGHHAGVTSVRYSMNGKYITSGGLDESVRVWDANVRCIDTYEENSNKDTTCWNVSSLLFDSNGDIFLSGSEDHIIRIWSMAKNGEMLYAITKVPFVPHFLATIGDGEQRIIFVASHSNHTLCIYQHTELKTRIDIGTSSSSSIVGMTLSSDAKRIAIASQDQSIRIFVVSGVELTLLHTFQQVSEIRSIEFGISCQILNVVLANGQAIRYTDGVSVEPVRMVDAGVSDLTLALRSAASGVSGAILLGSLSPFGDRNLVATVGIDGVIHVWNTSNGAIVDSLPTSCRGIRTLHWSNATTLFVGGNNFLTFVWKFSTTSSSSSSNSNSMIPYQFFGHDDHVTCLTSYLDGDRQLFLSGSLDNSIIVWDVSKVNIGEQADDSTSSSASIGRTPLIPPIPLHTFLFETERIAPSGSVHIYECHAGQRNINRPTTTTDARAQEEEDE